MVEFGKQIAIYFVAPCADSIRVRWRFGFKINPLAHATARLVQMGAVVELAMPQMLRQIGHQSGQLHRLNMVKTKFLESGAVDQGRLAGWIQPVESGRGGGVFA